MQRLATACEAIAATTKKLLKTAIVADYLKSRTPEEAAVSAVFLSGRPFPVWEETTLQIGGRSLWQIVAELSGKSEDELTHQYRQRRRRGPSRTPRPRFGRAAGGNLVSSDRRCTRAGGTMGTGNR